MATKLAKGIIPGNGSLNDFQCFGPVASKDGQFEDVMLADLGCFKQGEVDSNKYYHAAIVQCKSNSKWYVYCEWGRTGNTKPQFQFVECYSKADAQEAFSDQLHSKNDKRGQWVRVSGIATLEAKPGKDVYLVREQAVRTTGLPDAKNITSMVTGTVVVSKKTNGKKITVQPEVTSLLRDLNVGTVAYTRSNMATNDLPTKKAISEAKDILQAARGRIAVLPTIEDQLADRDLVLLTNTLYSRIPKIKKRNAQVDEWLLTGNNIDRWNLDLEAFESALGAVAVEETNENPYGELPLEMEWLGNARNPLTDMAKWICMWMPEATNNKHSYLRALKIRGIWAIHRKDGLDDISEFQKGIASIEERPLFQEALKTRPDLTPEQRKAWRKSNTSLLFHGTRSCNVRGILASTLKMPANLVGVHTTAAMFGQAIYFADDFKKSVGYTSHSDAVYTSGAGCIPNRTAFIFLGDVALGNVYVAPRPAGFVAPPVGFNSVMGKGGHTKVRPNSEKRLMNNEYIVYRSRQNTLKYLIEFDA